MRDNLTKRMREDVSGWQDILNLPEKLASDMARE
jgi:hypothetical protein